MVFSEVFNTQLGEAVGNSVDEGLEDGLFIVANDKNFLNFGDIRNGAEAMLNDWVAGDGKEGLQCRLASVRGVRSHESYHPRC